MTFYNTALDLVIEPISTGSFTNHGRFVRLAEKKLDNYFETAFYSAVFGSRVIGLAVLLWIYREDKVNIIGLSKKEYQEVVDVLGQVHFSNQDTTFFTIGDLKDNKIANSNSKNLLIERGNHLSNTKLNSKKIKFDGLFLTCIESNIYSYDIQKLVDYSVILMPDKNTHSEVTHMRSSYGGSEISTDVFATLNGRPSEIVGNLLCKIIV